MRPKKITQDKGLNSFSSAHHNLRNSITRVTLLLLIVYLLPISLLSNSIDYNFQLINGSLKIASLGNVFEVPAEEIPKDNETRISLIPQNRYSTPQGLFERKNYLENLKSLIGILILRTSAKEIILPNLKNWQKSFIYFNPFRATLNIYFGTNNYRIETNIPDATMEFWKSNEKTKTYTLKVPWLRLALAPIISSLLIAGLIPILLPLKLPNAQMIEGSDKKKKAGERKEDLLISFSCFFLGTLLIAYIFLHFFKAAPGFGDEMNYLIQAKIFADGKVFVNQPALSEFFRVDWMNIFGKDGKLWNFQPPGNSLILALGWLLGLKWITVPIIGGLIITVQFLLARSLTQKNTFALLHTSLFASSHYILSLASSYMAHPPALLFISSFYLFVIKYFNEKKTYYLYLASLFIGLAFITRPLSTVLASPIPLACLVVYTFKDRKNITPLLISFFIGILVSSLIFLYSFLITGKYDFPYLLKGPETGQTLSARLSKNWDYHLSNLYRNTNEFQNRSYSLGFIFNFVPFLIPLFYLKRNPKLRYILLGYLTFFGYLIAHSLLHWYGWKWEPRMIYEISFIFFLLSSYGLLLIWEGLNHKLFRLFFLCFLVIIFVSVYLFDLPKRFSIEYKNYNFSPTGVRDSVEKMGLKNSIIFFPDKKTLAPYTPDNSIKFDGNIIYALNQGENYNYKLISQFPDRDIYYTTDGDAIVKNKNFLKKDLRRLGELLLRDKFKSAIVVLPWLKFISTDILAEYPAVFMDESELLESIRNKLLSLIKRRDIILVGEANNLSAILEPLYNMTKLKIEGDTDYEISYYSVANGFVKNAQKIPGIMMKCFSGTQWQSEPFEIKMVSTIDITACRGENRSIIWRSTFVPQVAQQLVFYLSSDDGSQLLINQNLIIDKADESTNQEGTAVFNIEANKEYSLEIRYFNGPSEGFINIGTIDDSSRTKLNLRSIKPYLFIE